MSIQIILEGAEALEYVMLSRAVPEVKVRAGLVDFPKDAPATTPETTEPQAPSSFAPPAIPGEPVKRQRGRRPKPEEAKAEAIGQTTIPTDPFVKEEAWIKAGGPATVSESAAAAEKPVPAKTARDTAATVRAYAAWADENKKGTGTPLLVAKLKAAGVGRVTDLKGDALTAFLDALEAEMKVAA